MPGLANPVGVVKLEPAHNNGWTHGERAYVRDG